MSTHQKLQGKVAVITGGNAGIGLATARLFKAEGAKVVITASSASSFAKAQKELGKDFDVVQCDVSDLKQIDALYAHVKAKYGGIDCLYANAGIAAFSPLQSATEEFYDKQYNTNVKGAYFSVAKAIPLLLGRPGGATVIVCASVVAEKGLPGGSVYTSTKAALRNMVRSWTAEFDPKEIRFNSLSPGVTTTGILERGGQTPEQAKQTEAALVANIPIKRAATADEIAQGALFLASSDSSYVVGFDLVMDGGLAQV